MWVESEVTKGSKFFFTISSRISRVSMETIMAKMAPFTNRTILYVDTLGDKTGVAEQMSQLGLKPYVVHSVTEVGSEPPGQHIDTIVVDHLTVVCIFHVLLSSGSRASRPRASGNLIISDIYRSCLLHPQYPN